jgi:hypothetical protein
MRKERWRILKLSFIKAKEESDLEQTRQRWGSP